MKLYELKNKVVGAVFFNLPTMCVLVAQQRLTLWNRMGCSPPGSSVHVILQARILEWVAIPISRGSSLPRDRTRVSRFAGRFFTICVTREALSLRHTEIGGYPNF